MTETLVRQGRDYHSRFVLGPMTEEYVQRGDQRWYRDRNGIAFPSKEEDQLSFLMFRVLDEANDPKNDVTLLGEVALPSPAYVVQVKMPQNKHPEWLFFDKATNLITRTERQSGKHRFVTTYDDYRKTRGLTEPWHIHDSEGDAALDDDYKRTAYEPYTPAADEYALSTTGRFKQVTSPLDLHAKFLYGNPVVRLNVKGRGLDFVLSMGDPDSLIDAQVAKELDLPTFGHARDGGDGGHVAYGTILDDATIGDTLRIKNFAIEAMPFHFHLRDDVKIVGVLGADFLSQATFKFDYVNQAVTAMPAAQFDTKEVDDAYNFPIAFDAGYPFVKGTIGGHETENILLNNYFDFSFVFGSFSQKFPDAVADTKGNKHAQGTVPFADSGSYGRDVDLWIANLDDVFFGPAHFKNYKIVASDAEIVYGGHDIDAVMGSDLLAFYDVYLDYPHSRIFLKQNEYFWKTFRKVP